MLSIRTLTDPLLDGTSLDSFKMFIFVSNEMTRYRYDSKNVVRE